MIILAFFEAVEAVSRILASRPMDIVEDISVSCELLREHIASRLYIVLEEIFPKLS